MKERHKIQQMYALKVTEKELLSLTQKRTGFVPPDAQPYQLAGQLGFYEYNFVKAKFFRIKNNGVEKMFSEESKEDKTVYLHIIEGKPPIKLKSNTLCDSVVSAACKDENICRLREEQGDKWFKEHLRYVYAVVYEQSADDFTW